MFVNKYDSKEKGEGNFHGQRYLVLSPSKCRALRDYQKKCSFWDIVKNAQYYGVFPY